MLQSFILTTFRSFWKNRNHTLINILGLSLGITCSILIFLIIRFELSFDNYHPNGERMFRLVTEFTGGEKMGYSSGMTYPLPPTLRNDFPDPEYVILIDANMSDPVITITHGDGKADRYTEQRVAFVDPDYFKMFHYDWVEGNRDALVNEKTVVLSESIAKKYFGNESPLNQTINFNNEYDVTVTGVIKDPPRNTDFPFTILLSSKLGANKRGWDSWGASASSVQCYIQLKPTTTEEAFEGKLKGWHYKYFTGDNERDGKNRTYVLQPLGDLHFNTNFSNFAHRTISKLTLLTLSFIGVVLLLTACINFINLSTVLIINRARETGIRKVLGSSGRQLLAQFLGETWMITTVALIISMGLVELALLYVTPNFGYTLAFDVITDKVTMVTLVLLVIIITLLSGLYPGITLSRYQPARALKNKITGVGEGLTLRRSLVIFQLVISQVLIVCTVIAVQQINHFMAQPLGISSDGVVEFRLPENKPEQIRTLRERLEQIPGVIIASMSNTGSTSDNAWGGDAEVTVNNKIEHINANIKFADHNYLETYQIELLHGENLIESDTATRFLVNEAFVKALGFADPNDVIGLPVNMWGNRALIQGVVKDFNTNSLHAQLRPTIIFCGTDAYYVGAIRLKTSDVRQSIASLKSVWEDIYPKFVFQHSFLDETIASFYERERRNAYLIGLFAGVAIFIGCIGLFGLVSFMAKARTKEVGIRKTLGASVAQVIALFSKEFVVLVGISFILATPLAYYFMEGWLENFAYRIHPGVSTFLIGVTITVFIVLSTVGIKSYNAAVANPIDALKDE